VALSRRLSSSLMVERHDERHVIYDVRTDAWSLAGSPACHCHELVSGRCVCVCVCVSVCVRVTDCVCVLLVSPVYISVPPGARRSLPSVATAAAAAAAASGRD